MKNIELFDASLPCPGGIYGENPDPRMIEVANVLNTLEQHGYYVHRYDMAVEPRAYVLNPEVR
ncbi:MAG: arsenic metallochaperone ArsD family protein, partial [Oscillospiraceae bacterium]|nr:arsenic metallochaperone ArsD family protein [Oscillospiraceae bacterium]